MTKLLQLSQINEAATILREGGVVAFPTDTVYGLGVDLSNQAAIAKLSLAKQRPDSKPYALMVNHINQIEALADLSLRDRELIKTFMPGAISMIFRKKASITEGYFGQSNTIAFRMPKDPYINDLISLVKQPLLVPSANISGLAPALNSDEVFSQLDNKIDAVVEGVSGQSLASTIIDCSNDELSLIRKGPIDFEEVIASLQIHKPLRIAIATDHGGYQDKEAIKEYLLRVGYEVKDYGCFSEASVDYPDTVYPAVVSVKKQINDVGIVLCGTGIGASITANKVKGIRCALVQDKQTALISKEHNDANVLALGGRILSAEEAIGIVQTWLISPFSEEERHQRRINKIAEIETKEQT
ncbi:MAG: L-threonylcarbamoyladenylate synthase [Erysipelotrichaceae bacterium]